jgi:integrase
MPLSFSAYFDESRGYYRARRWGKIAGKWIDGAVRIPDDWWKQRGFNPPAAPSEKFDTLAMRFAAKEADEHEKKVLADLSAFASPKKMTLGRVFALYKEMQPRKVEPSTVAKWDHDFAKLTEFIDPHALPEEIDIAIATRYRNWRLQQKRRIGTRETDKDVRNRTVWNELIFLRQIVHFALDWQSETGAEMVRFHRLPELEIQDTLQRALSEEEFVAVYEKADDRDRDILVTGVTAMLRASNLLGFDASWADLEKRWLHIDKALMKGRRGERRDLDVPISRWTAETIEKYGQSEGALFTSLRTGEALTWYTHVLRDLATSAGIPPFNLRSLRATGNSWLYAAGVQPLAIGRLMNHVPPQQTRQLSATPIYTHIGEKQLRQAVAHFDKIRKRLGLVS